MKIDIAKLINEVSKHPEIYNPDHKDFANKEIRDNIFNTIIKNEMNGIKGETLQQKWDQILNKYANFIRKLSREDSSEKVLERFMKWPWTKPMRIFKPYVRKQFQIPEFQSGFDLLPEIDLDIPHIPMSALQPLRTMRIIEDDPEYNAMAALELPAENGPEQQNDGVAGQQQVVRYVRALPPPIPYGGISNENETPAVNPRPTNSHQAHPIPEPTLEIPLITPIEIMEIPLMANTGFMGPEYIRAMPASHLPQFMGNLNRNRSPSSSQRDPIGEDDDYSELGRTITAAMIQDIQRMITLGQIPEHILRGDGDEDEDDNDDDDDNAADDEIATDDEAVATVDDGPSTSKKRRREEQSSKNGNKSDKGGTGAVGDKSRKGDDENDGQTDVLPDLPQPKPAVKSGPSDFSPQEHIFLAWAKTMSTFTAKRQATIKMQINKIMSEAEFEDLDDEFFAG